MKKHLRFIITSLALLWSTSSYADDGTLGFGGGANNNPHNLSSQSTSGANIADTETQICIFCHTPHGATPLSTLWSRPAPIGPNLDGSFPTLTTPALNISDIVTDTEYSTSPAYPNGTSKLCLSCHDGVTAMGILANGDEITMTGNGLVTGTAVIDLTKTHPISFIYNATVVAYLETQLPGAYQFPPDPGYLETDSSGITRVQCTTCHQPHQDTIETGGIYPFWRYGNGDPTDYDPVCQECHTSTPTRTEHAYP